MKKNKKPGQRRTQAAQTEMKSSASSEVQAEKPITFKDLLSAEAIHQLQATANEMKERERMQEEQRRNEERLRKEKEQKELENNFEYLLNQTDLNPKNKNRS